MLSLRYSLRGADGRVEVQVEPNMNPEQIGCLPAARGFPVCSASVEYDGRGYDGACGWIQLVRSTDGRSDEFELDPFEPLGPAPHPFCWFGFEPTLFDAPWRDAGEDIEWVANSFLGFISAPRTDREARALLGFSWGFATSGQAISLREPEPLGESDWNRHLPLLRGEHPEWLFADGYRVD